MATLNLTLYADGPINHLHNWMEKTITFEVSQNTQTIIDPAETAQKLALSAAANCSGEDQCPNGANESRILLAEISWSGEGLYRTTTLEMQEGSLTPVVIAT